MLWVRLLEGNPLEIALHEARGGFGQSGVPGTNSVLSSPNAKLYLKGTSTQADSPTDPSVVLTLDVSFKKPAGGRDYTVEVKASDDLGNHQDWQRAGTLTVVQTNGRGQDDD